MADENLPRSVPDAGKESPAEPSSLSSAAYVPPSRKNSKRRRNMFIAIVVAVVLVGGFFLWRYFNSLRINR